MQIEMRKSHHQFENETRTSLTNQATKLRNLEVQVGQMASMINKRQQGNFSSTSEVNPRSYGKEHCKVITLRSGKMVEIDIHAHKGNAIKENNKNDETPTQNVKNNAETVGNSRRSSKILVENTPTKVKESSIKDTLNVPYPQRLRRKQLD